jgi:hypothetical protein
VDENTDMYPRNLAYMMQAFGFFFLKQRVLAAPLGAGQDKKMAEATGHRLEPFSSDLEDCFDVSPT